MQAPRQHKSHFEVISRLERQSCALEEETPLFAADRDFAHEVGGPLTRAFLATLPQDQEVVIDSSLVWLVQGVPHDDALAQAGQGATRRPPPFRHEPFPGATDGARGACNQARSRQHRLCVLGVGPAPVVAWGQVALEDQEDPDDFWAPRDVYRRDARIRGWLRQGRLQPRPLPLDTVVALRWGSLLCPRPARRSGFQLVLRATWGAPQPVVNGLRNVSFL